MTVHVHWCSRRLWAVSLLLLALAAPALGQCGSLVQWGNAGGDQLNNAPAASERFVAVAARWAHNLALRADGSLVQWGGTSFGQTDSTPAASERFTAIAAGIFHSLALQGVPNRLAFTYQGRLQGAPAPGIAADPRFSLWNAPCGGLASGPALTYPGVPLSPLGLFTALTPRQRLGATPLAAVANRATAADLAAIAASAANVPFTGIVGVPAGFADGVDDTGASSQWADLPSGLGYTGPGGTSVNGIRLTHGAEGSSWDLLVGGSGISFAGGFAVAEAGSAKLVVQAATGNVGLGTTAPTALLSVNGTASKPGGGSWATFSDARLKHDITPLEGSLEKLLALRGVSFTYDDPKAIGELPGRRIGMVAQEVEGVFPDWVDTGPSGYKSLTFRGLEALTVEALRELKEENDALRRELAELRAGSGRDELRARLERFEALLSGHTGQSPTDDFKK